MDRLNYRIFFPFLLIIILSSCSVVGEYWYERIDKYITDQFLEYASFSDSQETLIKKSAEDFKNWNLESELPRYKEYILRFKLLDDTTDINNIEELYQDGILLGNRSRDFFIPYLIELSESLTNDQTKEIEIYLNDLNEKRETSLKEEKKDYGEILEDSFIRVFRLMGVKLNSKQKDIIRLHTNNLIDSRSDLIERRQLWNKELLNIIALKNKIILEQSLVRHINSIDSEDEKTRMIINQTTAEIVASLDSKQRKKFRKRLEKFIRTIDTILGIES